MKITAPVRKRTTHSGGGITPAAPCIRSVRACSTSPISSSHFAERGFLCWLLRLDPLGRSKEPDAPRVESALVCALLHTGPFVERDVAAVADDVARETLFLARGQELRGLEELPRQERLGVGAALGLVVAREGEDDDQTEQDREARREHAEDARGPVTVGEVAAFRRASPHEQHHRDRRCGDGDGEQARPEDVHLGRSVCRGDRLSLRALACIGTWSSCRQPTRSRCTCSAPTIGSSGIGSSAGWRMNGCV